MNRKAAQMGEIRVDVTLTNAFDHSLERRGSLTFAEVRSVTVSAMVDTGAIRSCIPRELADQLGLRTMKEMQVELADGGNVTVGLTEPLEFDLLDRTTVDSALVLGNEVLLGQTILETTDLLADCANQRLIPNPAHPDGPVLKVKRARES
ncbi:MAG: retroviral-like aspartic protease family protein [Lacipirellulaceae bacterium]